MKENKEAKENKENKETKALVKTEELLQNLLEMMRPKKPGLTEINMHWFPPVVRIHQNNSRNPPAHSTPGCLYTDTGDVLEKPWKFYPLYVHQANINIEETDDGDLLICRSEDGIISTRGDECSKCPKAPYKDPSEIRCRRTVEFYVIDENLTQIYKVVFSKTSYRVGIKLLRQISGTKVPWQRKYALGVEQNSKNTLKYYVFTVTPTTETPSDELAAAFGKLCAEITAQRKEYLEALKQQVHDVEVMDAEVKDL